MVRSINKVLLILILAHLQISVYGQDTIRMDISGVPVYGRIIDGDTVIISNIKEANIKPRTAFASNRDMRQYRQLVYNVKKAYPYAIIAGEMFRDVELTLASLETEKQRKEYIKQFEKDLRSRFEGELTKLTITQGRILIKLIDRETMHTSYDLVKELRGSIQAVFWQTIARLFGSNLKSSYDPYGEDSLIEEIIILIEYGMI